MSASNPQPAPLTQEEAALAYKLVSSIVALPHKPTGWDKPHVQLLLRLKALAGNLVP